MSNYHQDQAAGLRRIMATPKPRVVSIISASVSHNQPQLIQNLAASIVAEDNEVLIIHASTESRESHYGLEKALSLLDVAAAKTSMQNAIRNSKNGFSVAKMMPRNYLQTPLNETGNKRLAHTFSQLASLYDIVLVDATLNEQNQLALPMLNEAEMIIQLTRKPDSITQAYSLIKQICSELGRRSFGIIVQDATDEQALVVFRNISEVAKRFMQIELEYFGAIPADEHLGRASKLGRSVIDAFPFANASTALKKIAQRLDFKHDYAGNIKQASYS